MSAETKKDPIDLWVEALRSGEYEQTMGVLCRVSEEGEKSYCCLGVACEVYRKEVGGLGTSVDGTLVRFGGKKRGEVAVLPERVRDWLGLATSSGHTGKCDGLANIALTSYNDHHGWSFKKIAAHIERRPKGLFEKKDGES